MSLEDLKKQYEEEQKKHKLPGFSDVNNYFEIDRIDRDMEHLIRDVRKVMIEKILELTRLVEMLLNPSNAPPQFLQFVKRITSEDRAILQRVYERFVLLELESLACDLKYDAAREGALINSAYTAWDQMHSDMQAIITLMGRNFSQTSDKKEKSYLG